MTCVTCLHGVSGLWRKSYKGGLKNFLNKNEIRKGAVALSKACIQYFSDFAGYSKLELEAFVHGAMCMSVSGRCLISSFLTDRSANKGACTQPCR